MYVKIRLLSTSIYIISLFQLYIKYYLTEMCEREKEREGIEEGMLIFAIENIKSLFANATRDARIIIIIIRCDETSPNDSEANICRLLRTTH